jgi:hypothetical protein
MTISVSILLSSCLFPKTIVSKNKPINENSYNKLKTGKTYVFHFKNGSKEKVKIEKKDSLTIYGVSFSYNSKKNPKSFEMNLEEIRSNVEKIVKKRSLEAHVGSGLLITSAVLITIYVFGVIAVMWFISLFI